MDYKYIEELVTKAKNNDELAKEKLAGEFRPLIINLSKRTFIDGYDIQDIRSECYRILFKCVSLYNLESHRFVAYASNGIRNSINDIIKRSKKRSTAEGYESLTLSNNLEHTLPDHNSNFDDILCDQADYEIIRLALDKLNESERELIDFVFFKNNTVSKYASSKNLCYTTAAMRKKLTLKKLFKYINSYNQIAQ